MEVNLLQRRKVLEDKIPEIEKTIAMVEFLTEKQQGGEPVYTDYELNDTLYCKAKVEPSGTVYLWLGVSDCWSADEQVDNVSLCDQANVMLEYTFDEAKDLLSSKCETAKTSLKNTIEDLEFLRDQITTMEVSKYQCFEWMCFIEC